MRPLLAATLLTLFVSSCSKIGTLPGPPGTVLQSLEKFPLRQYIDSSTTLMNSQPNSIFFEINSVTLNDPFIIHPVTPGQALIAMAFRTNAPAAITSLALQLPASGFTHTVTLWDSATGAVLARIDVPSLNAGKWTSVSLAFNGQAVPILPGNGYIVGYNTLATGNAIGSNSPGNALYILNGIYDYSLDGGHGDFRPILPFTEYAITYETAWEIDYDNPNARLPFPGSIAPNSGGSALLGFVDIGYVAAP
jgi:hypothetical protein